MERKEGEGRSRDSIGSEGEYREEKEGKRQSSHPFARNLVSLEYNNAVETE